MKRKMTPLEKMRRERGMTQSAFARFIGISEPHLSMVLRGTRRLGIDNAIRISRLLGVKMESLFQ